LDGITSNSDFQFEEITIAELQKGYTNGDFTITEVVQSYLNRIQDIDQKQTLKERLLSVGDITILSHDSSHPEIIFNDIKEPQEVHEILRRAILSARKKHGLRYREEM